jgi:hypothetical protein
MDDGVSLTAQEDTSKDSETAHTAESVDYFVMGGEGLLSGETPVPPTPPTSSPVAGLEMAQYGSVMADSSLQTVTLDHSFVNPVVIATVVTANETDPVTVRLTDVQSDSFSFYLQEPSSEDGAHGFEQVSFLVIEAGTWRLADGTVIEAGTLDSDRLSWAGFESVGFETTFASAPAILTQVQTDNDSAFVETRLDGESLSGFQVAMTEEEATNGGAHGEETIGWIAIEEGTGTWDGLLFEAGSTPDAVTEASYDLDFLQTYETDPGMLAKLSSYDGSDPSWLGVESVGLSDATINLEEETSADSETGHYTETADYLVMEGSGVLSAEAESLGGPISVPSGPQIIAQFGATVGSNYVQTVQLDWSFVNPIVIARVTSANESDYMNVRITDVQSDQFSFYLQEPVYEDGAHVVEDVSFLVVEAGTWQLADGTLLEAGALDSNLLSWSGFESVSFETNFLTDPAVLSQVQSQNDFAVVETRMKNGDEDGFQISMSELEAYNGGSHGTETLGWIAIEQGSGSWDGLLYEAGDTTRQVSDGGYDLTFDNSYETTPGVLGSLSSYYGPDPAMLQIDDLLSDGVTLIAEEDTSKDAEIAHVVETADYFVMDGSGLLSGTQTPTESLEAIV